MVKVSQFTVSKDKVVGLVLLLVFFWVVVFGSIGSGYYIWQLVVGLGVGLGLLLYGYFSSGKRLQIPKTFVGYVCFLILLGVSIFWSGSKKDTYEFLLLFVGGGIVWLSFYNLNSKWRDWFVGGLVGLGLLYMALMVLHEYLGITIIHYWPSSLIYQANAYGEHNHLGDLWAVILVVVVDQLVRKRTWQVGILLVLGLVALALSLSRSAYVSLVVGLVYLFWKRGWFERYKRLFVLLLAVAIGLFIYAGNYKSVLGTRDYYIQAAASIIKNPWGVGVGNFGEVSGDPAMHWWGRDHFSFYTHNIVLEFTVGTWVLGLGLLAWLVMVLGGVIEDEQREGIVIRAMFLALTVNFMFNTTYAIPAMVWLWFGLLGMGQSVKRTDL